MKKIIALLLVTVLVAGVFAGCQTPAENTPTEPKIEKDDGVLKILLFGHSLGNDSVWMLPEVFANEAPDQKVVIGFLYYSGCWVSQHIVYAQDDMAVYGYCEYDSESDTYWRVAQTNGTFERLTHGSTLNGSEPSNGISQTSKFALQQHDWDIVMMQSYPWEAANISSGSQIANLAENIQILENYILENDIDKDTTPEFGWNMVWGFTPDTNIMRDFDQSTLNSHFPSTEGIMKQAELWFSKMSSVMKDELMPKYNFAYLMPSAAAFFNAYTSYMEPVDLHRDYAHASDFSRVMIAYLWYCVLTDTAITDCKIEPINYEYVKDDISYKLKQDLELSESQRNVLIECVGNAIAKPYEIVQSQYTEAPAQ